MVFNILLPRREKAWIFVIFHWNNKTLVMFVILVFKVLSFLTWRTEGILILVQLYKQCPLISFGHHCGSEKRTSSLPKANSTCQSPYPEAREKGCSLSPQNTIISNALETTEKNPTPIASLMDTEHRGVYRLNSKAMDPHTHQTFIYLRPVWYSWYWKHGVSFPLALHSSS